MEIIRSHRNSIAIIVKNGGEVVVRAPFYMNQKKILKYVQEKQGWIQQALSKQKPIEEYGYLLKKYTKEVPTLELLKKNARDRIFPRVRHYSEIPGLLPKGTRPGKMGITNARTRWGSCSGNNNMNFSWRLGLCPEFVIDYVVVHELCHVTHKNHSRSFWKMVEEYYPKYKESESWLKENATILLLEP